MHNDNNFLLLIYKILSIKYYKAIQIQCQIKMDFAKISLKGFS